MDELKWIMRENDDQIPDKEGWYRVMVSGDSESIDGHVIYSFEDYETWAQFVLYEGEGGAFHGIHDEDTSTIFAYYGPIVWPKYESPK
jgi:hypothetical protein